MTDRVLRPIILIGAARSGTKALRDALALASGVPAVPYDMTYVWRFGNDRASHDRQVPADIHPRTARMVTRVLGRYADADGRVIEKTVGNTLRAGYVAGLVPDAVFVHLIRDGVEVAESTRRQWLEPADLSYLKDKLRHFPPRLLLTYGQRYLRWLIRRRLNPDGRVGSWGPRYPGIDDDVDDEPLLKVCARQWRTSLELARTDFSSYDIEHVEVRYEALVKEPARELGRILEFAGLASETTQIEHAAATIRCGYGGAADRLDESELALLDAEIGDLLGSLGYARHPAARRTDA